MTNLTKIISKLILKSPETNMFSIKKLITFTLMILMLAGTTGCNNSKEEINKNLNDITSLQNAQDKWNNHSQQYYTVQSQRFCFCLPEMSSHMEISVLDNSLLSAVDIDSHAVISKEVLQEIPTVDDLFTLIAKAIEDDISIDVNYNEEYGYPETTKIDVEQLAADGGLHIVLSELTFQEPQFALDDVNWTLQSFDNIAGPQPVIENTNITLSFDMEAMQLKGVGGCNNYTADFELGNESYNITVLNISSTEMWCDEPEEVMQQEQEFFTTLAQIQLFYFDKATLNMGFGADAGFHFVPTQVTLDNVAWALQSFDNIAGPQPIIENTHISLYMDMENSQLGGFAGCNTYGADFVQDENSNSITILNIISTQMWCEVPENIMQQEQNYFDTLVQTNTFILDEASLSLIIGADAGLNFVIEPSM